MANNERISALVDGDAEAANWLKAVVQDGEQQQVWSRYHLIGDAMRNELPKQLDTDLASRIAAALADEPTVLAPVAKATTSRWQPAVVRVLRGAGQFAMAASVAAVTILGVQHYNANSLATGTHPTVLNTVPVGGVAAPVSINFQNPRQLTEHTAQPASNRVQQQAERERMAVFLRDHQLQQRLHQSEK